MVFYKQVLEFHCPSKFLCQTSGRQNHWSLMWREGGWRKMKENNVRGKRIQENVCEKVDIGG